MSKELDKFNKMSVETKYEFNVYVRELGKDLTNLMELLRQQDKDNKPILYAGKHIKNKVILPYKEYQKMQQALLKAQEQEKVLEIIKETKNIKTSFYENGSGKHYKLEFDRTKNQTITKEEFDTLKEYLG